MVPWSVYLNEVRLKSEQFGAQRGGDEDLRWVCSSCAVAVPGESNVPSWKEPNFPSHLA